MDSRERETILSWIQWGWRAQDFEREPNGWKIYQCYL